MIAKNKAAIVLVVVCGLLFAANSSAATKVVAKKYKNCAALNKVYSGGVAMPGVINTGGKTKNKPTYNKALYQANKGLDRDRDNIACER